MHTFKNFKNFADAEIDLSKPMTLLIGRNGSGKSNVIEGVELFSKLQLNKLLEITDIGQGGQLEIRGGLQGCFRQGTNYFQVRVKTKSSPPLAVYHYELNVKSNPISLNMNGAMPSPSGSLVYDEIFKKTFVFDIYPRTMRQYSPIGLNQLSRNGSNISSVLYYLKQNQSDILEGILRNIKQLPEEEFVSFEFITTSDNSDVLFALKYPNGEIISAKLLSDGTLRALAILTALETVPEGSRIIIEEIDNGIHPSKAKMLIDAIWERSKERKLNTLITTHNPATLDSLNDEQLECVVVCHYDKQSESAKLTPFFELPRVGVLLQKGKLGNLVTRNVIERYLEPDFEERRKTKIKSWMEIVE